MKMFYLVLLMMLGVAEILFTAFYIYLTHTIDEVPFVGALAYLGTVYCMHRGYQHEDYQSQRKEMIRNLISGS